MTLPNDQPKENQRPYTAFDYTVKDLGVYKNVLNYKLPEFFMGNASAQTREMEILSGGIVDYKATGVFYIGSVFNRVVVVFQGTICLVLPGSYKDVFRNQWDYMPYMMRGWLDRNPMGVVQAKNWSDLAKVLMGSQTITHKELDGVCKALRLMRKLGFVGREFDMFYLNPCIIPANRNTQVGQFDWPW